jgi:aminoglycoside phosphotransferase (APT) family kinase protein
MTSADRERIDPAALLASAGLPAPLAAEPVAGGWDTELWRVTLPDGRVRALRVYRTGSNDLAATREASALRALAAGGVPAPAVEAIGSYRSRPFLVLAWLRGRPMLDLLSARPWDLWRLGSTLGRLQARIHTLPPPPGVTEAQNWADVPSDPALAAAVQAAAGPPVFCHGDFHPANVMVAPAGITGVIDLAKAMAADRRADLGITEASCCGAAAADPLRPSSRHCAASSRAWRAGYRAQAGDFP